MNDKMRRKSLLYLSLVILGMLLLAGSLSALQFQTGMPVPGAEPAAVAGESTAEAGVSSVDLRWILQLSLALLFSVLLVVILVSIIRKVKIKRILAAAAGLLVVLCLFILVNQMEAPQTPRPVSEIQGIEPQAPPSYEIAPIGNPPQELFQIVVIILITGASLLLVWLVYQALHRIKKKDLIAGEADSALKAIENGDDLHNVIIRTYLQMLKIASEEQGIERADSATPREFERVMAARGIPAAPLHQLTALFEKVRYGSKATDAQDEQSAVECLSAIRAFAKPIKQGSR
jgi:hypothetical protein